MSYNSVVAADTPVAWWRLDEGSGSSSAADSSGNSHTGSPTSVTFGVASAPAGMTQTCASFNGTTSKIDITGYGGPGGINSPAQSYEAWVNRNNTSTAGRFIANAHNPGTPNGGFACRVNGTAQAEIDLWNASFGGFPTSGGSVAATGWVYLAFVLTGSNGNVLVYVNGSQVASSSESNNTPLTGTGDVNIGCQTGGFDFWNGYLCQVAIYNYNLTSTQVTNHYNAGSTAAVAAAVAPGQAVSARLGNTLSRAGLIYV